MALLDPGLVETARRGMMTSAAVERPAQLERVRLTQAFNAAKLPAASCPWGLGPAGLPEAVQLAAPHFREDLLLRGSAVLEAAMPTKHPARYENV